MKQKLEKVLLFTTCLMFSSAVLAGGSIFGGHKTRTSNPDGVSTIGIHICGSLNCPNVILKKGDCGSVDHATLKYGVCACDDGYETAGDFCVKKDKNYDGIECSDYINNTGCGGKGSDWYCQSSANECTNGGNGVCQRVPDGWVLTTSDGHIYLNQKMDWFSANALCVARGRSGLITSSIAGIPLNEPSDAMSDERYEHKIKNVLGTTGLFWTNYGADGQKTTSNNTSCGAYFVFTNDNYDLVADPKRNYTELSPLCE